MEDLKKHITQLREDFTKGSLNESDAAKNPFIQFETWLQQAVMAEVPEVQAMNLATVSEAGKPSSRIVYLREFENNCFWFYTNYNSRKAKEILTSPLVAMTFFWPELERQVRIEGVVKKASVAESDAYFKARPFESQLGAWASNQSDTITSRDELEKKIEDLKKQYTPENIPRPDFWGGFVVEANYYEFWQGRKSRLHDRISYHLTTNNWVISRLSP